MNVLRGLSYTLVIGVVGAALWGAVEIARNEDIRRLENALNTQEQIIEGMTFSHYVRKIQACPTFRRSNYEEVQNELLERNPYIKDPNIIKFNDYIDLPKCPDQQP